MSATSLMSAPAPASNTLQLDPRARAMLAEMGVWTHDFEKNGVFIDPVATHKVAEKPLIVSGKASIFPAKKPLIFSPVAVPVVASIKAVAPVSHTDMASLQRTLSQCQACTLATGRTQVVCGEGGEGDVSGVAQADWLIVGDPPNDADDALGRPFAGDAGLLLDNMLKALGLNRKSRVYLTPIVKCRPPHNRNPEVAEVNQCSGYLQQQIALLRPKVIVGMGRFAVQALLADSPAAVQGQPLGQLRGQVLRYAGVPLVVTIAPSALLRSPQDKARAWGDWCLASHVVSQAQVAAQVAAQVDARANI